MTKESTVLMFKDIRRTLEALPDADAGILMKALFAHADGLEPEGLEKSPLASLVYPILEDQMDRLAEYRQAKAEAGRAGGIKSGQVRSKTKQNEANAKQSEPPYPSPYPYPSRIYNTHDGSDATAKVSDRKAKLIYDLAEQANVNINMIAVKPVEEMTNKQANALITSLRRRLTVGEAK